MKNKYIAYTELSVAMFFAGSTVVAGKFLINIPIFISQTISLLFAIIVIFPLAIINEGSLMEYKINKSDWYLIFLQGLTGIFIFRIFIILGLRFTSAVESGIIMSTTPAILALFSYFFIKEKITLRTIVGIGISVLGIILLCTNDIYISGSKLINMLGNMFVLIAVIGEVLFTIFRKLQSFDTKPLTTTAFVILFAFILFLPIGIYNSFYFNWHTIKLSNLISMFYYGVICSAIGYSFWFRGIAKVPVSSAAAFSGVMPISSVTLSTILLGESFTIQHLSGMVLVLIGIYTISRLPKLTIKDKISANNQT